MKTLVYPTGWKQLVTLLERCASDGFVRAYIHNLLPNWSNWVAFDPANDTGQQEGVSDIYGLLSPSSPFPRKGI